jgi:tetratricopeptide (TPR) repeat protein
MNYLGFMLKISKEYFLLSVFWLNLSFVLGFNKPVPTSDSCDQAKSLIIAASKLESPSKRLIEYQKAAALCPDADIPHYRLGMAYAEIEDEQKEPNYSRAENEFLKALSINPNNLGALFELAGIEYITGRFSKAESHYNKFLELNSKKDSHLEINDAAERLSIKCSWLGLLPYNSFDLKYLRKDPDRNAGVAVLIGEIANELGQAATQVTGQYGYGAAGLGIAIGSSIIAGSGEVNFNKISKYWKNNDYDQVYLLAKTMLPEAIENKGINSTEVQNLLELAYEGGLRSNLNKKNISEKDFIELAPFAKVYLYYNMPRFTSYTGLDYYTAIADAHEILGRYYAKDNPLKASQHYCNASIYWYKMNSSNPHYLKLSFQNRLKAALLKSSIASYDVVSLDSLIELNKYAIQSKNIENYQECVNSSFDSFYDWSKNLDRNKISIEGFIMYLDFFKELELSKEWNKNIFKLYFVTVKLLDTWGERNRAIALLEIIDKRGIPSDVESYVKMDYYKNCIIIYGNTGLFNKAIDAIGLLQELENNQNIIINYRIYLYKKMIIFKKNMDMPAILDLYNYMLKPYLIPNEKYIDISEILNWIIGSKPDSNDIHQLDSLLYPFKIACTDNWNRFDLNTKFLLENLTISNYQDNISLIYNQLLKIFNQYSGSDKSFDNQSLIYYINSNQLNLYYDLYQINNPIVETNERIDHLSYEYLFDGRTARIAIILHELGKYDQSLILRQQLLNKLLQYSDILPETVAEINVRIAEDLAALGKIQESEFLLNSAIKVYEDFSLQENTVKHQRAIDDLQKLLSGNADIAPHGPVAFEYYR